MYTRRILLRVRRMLLGGAVTSAVAAFLAYAGAPPEMRDPSAVVLFIGSFAVLVAVEVGFHPPAGWATLRGAAVGAILIGICGAVATSHANGLAYAFSGVPLGATAVMLYQLVRTAPMTTPVATPRRSPAPARSVMWDRELDG